MYTKTLCVVALLLLTFSSIAQKGKNAVDTDCERPNPLKPKVFNKMIVRDITYAIIGEVTPTSGLKVDISKPEATISGLFKPKKDSKVPWDLFSFDFKGGITDRNFNILKGNSSIGTSFEFKPSFHFIPLWSVGKFGSCVVARPAALIVDAKNQIVNANALALIDSINAIATVRKYYLKHLSPPDNPDISILSEASIDSTKKNLVIYFIKKFLKNDLLKIYVTDSLHIILNSLPPATISDGHVNASTYLDEVNETYKKYEKLLKTIDEDTDNKMINNANPIWTKKTFHWFTASPFIKSEKVNEYYRQFEGRDSSYFKSDYRLYYGVNVYYNWYTIIANKRAHLFRAALSLSYSNNLANLTPYNYEKRSPFFTSGSDVTQKIVSGTAYNHEDIKSGVTQQLGIEYYHLPFKSLFPGFYISTNLNYSNLYRLPNFVGREDDKMLLGAEGGLILNINSREKDKEKSLFSVLFYARYEDFTDKQRTSIKTGIVETQDDFRKRNFSLGIKIGIPITLPQSSN